MSPNVGNFVHDLVEMAKAMETLPQVQAELDRANTQIESYAKQVQAREIAIIGYKEEIETLHAKVRSLEVERDDASFRVLEAEDREHVALNMARSIASAVGNVINTLDPPKPESEKEPEAPAAETFSSQAAPDAAYSIPDTTLGQSESSPTSLTTSQENTQSRETDLSSNILEAGSASQSAEPSHGPYFGKRYYDQLAYVTLRDWLDGEGTEEDYRWRPELRQQY